MYKRFFKRPLDIIISLIGLILLSPIMLMTAVLVRTKLGSPVIFTQERPGKNEKIFKMYKFRSMTDERDQNGELLSDNIRLTKFGKFLRSTSLDELPELWNILKGDMSLVGPRPLLVEYLPYYKDEERVRHSVRPGLTVPDAVIKKAILTWDEQFESDMDYSKEITFNRDVKIVFLTFRKVLIRKQENYGGYTREKLSIERSEMNV